MLTSSIKKKDTKQSSSSLASLLDKGQGPSVSSGTRNGGQTEDDDGHTSNDDEQSGKSGSSAAAADGETNNDNRDQSPSLDLNSLPTGNASPSGPSGGGETKEKAGTAKGLASEQIRKMALAILARMNATREELGFPPWKATDDTLTHAMEHPSAASDDCFDDNETKQITLIHALAQRKAKSKREQSGQSRKRKLGQPATADADDAGSDDDEDEEESKEESGDSEIQSQSWTKTPLSDELKARMPPTWFGPAKESLSESEHSKTLRVKEAPAWANVPLIEDDAARKKLLAANAFSVKNGVGAGCKMPRAYDSKEELKDLKSRKGKTDNLLYRVLHKDIPASINRTTDVVRVIMCLLNSWNNSSSEESFECLNEVVLPLLLDNNIRQTDALQRVALNLAYDMSLPEDMSATAITSTASPLMRQYVDQASEKEKLQKSLKTLKTNTHHSSPSSSSTSSSQSSFGSFRGKRRGGSAFPPRSFGTGRGNGGGASTYKPFNNNNNNRGGGNNQFKASRGGMRGGRGGRGRGGGRGASSSSSNSSI